MFVVFTVKQQLPINDKNEISRRGNTAFTFYTNMQKNMTNALRQTVNTGTAFFQVCQLKMPVGTAVGRQFLFFKNLAAYNH